MESFDARRRANSFVRQVGATESDRRRGCPGDLGRAVLERWKTHGSPPIKEFAPYTAYLLLVDLFFCIGLGADLIGRERPTNKIDIAYLYYLQYLPFCMAFTSREKLHERTAPLFLDKEQEFADDLKVDLAKLDAYYSQLSDEEKLRGVMSFAHHPPVEGEFLVSTMWDKLMRPEWREWASRQPELRSKWGHLCISKGDPMMLRLPFSLTILTILWHFPGRTVGDTLFDGRSQSRL
jgi:hypothetical protein